ncbi:MAG: ABC transporter permease subunit, partial [Lachnospiraceae bacterium]|nr:ABC transporter permease subunit [Lachnospiraceae bacterium]
YLASICGIDNTYYEAAVLDGATKWQEIKYISIPSIKNVLFINILLSISGSIQVYEIPYIMMNGSNGTVTPVIQIQQSAFSDDRLGFAAALSIVVFIVVVIAVCLQNIVTKRGEE